jgi:hypothetical protein
MAPARPIPEPMPGWRAAAWPLGIVLASLALAHLARHGLVEPPHLTATCDAAPWQGVLCSLRTLTVQAFVQQRLGVAALAVALLATTMRWRWAAWLALATGSAALVLYATGLGASAVLLAALVCARPGPPGPARGRGAAR